MRAVVLGLVLLGLSSAVAAGFAADAAATKPIPPDKLTFVPHRIGHFRSEACGVGDFNNDGRLDIVAGPFLYLAPQFEPRKIRELEGSVNEEGKGYLDDFANVPMDVDGDGLLDVVSVSWFKEHAVWFRNPGNAEGLWKEALVEKNGNFETASLWDLKNSGKRDVILPCVLRTVWYELARDGDGKQSLVPHVVSEKASEFGNGVGDVNGDGRPDILRPSVWYETPADLRNGKWTEHPLSLGGKDGKVSHTSHIWTYDVNQDGLADILTSSAHDFGIFWYEQTREGNEIGWKQHTIDDTWSQAHAITLADIDNDGVPELVTGKRFMAHNGEDPGAFEPIGVSWYDLQPGPNPQWTKHAISFNEGLGAGMNIEVVDMNGDGRLDIVTTGKWGGPVWFENQGESQ